MRADTPGSSAERFGVAGATVGIGLAAGLSALFSLSFACAAPFAAFAAFAGLMGAPRFAMILVSAAWLSNQLVGFVMLDYPMTPESVGWGAALGFAALTATLAALIAYRRVAARLAKTGLAFLAAFVSFEAVLFAASVALPSAFDAFAPAVVARIFAINAVSFAGMLATRQLVEGLGRVVPSLLAPRDVSHPG